MTVGLDNTYAALNVTQRFLLGFDPEQKPVILDDFVDTSVEGGQIVLDKLRAKFDSISLGYTLKSRKDLAPDDVVVNPFGIETQSIKRVDEIIRTGKGLQVGVCNDEVLRDHIEYLAALDGTEATGIVGAMGYENAAQVTAQLMQKKDSLDKIYEAKSKKSKELEDHLGLIVKNGEVKPYEGK